MNAMSESKGGPSQEGDRMGQDHTGSSRCLDAFIIALDQTDSSRWYTSTLHLQLVLLQFCILCRGVPREHLIVDSAVSKKVWMDKRVCSRNVKPRVTRVPALRPRKLTWGLSQSEFPQCSRRLLANVKQLVCYEGGRSSPSQNGVDIDFAKFESLPSLQQLTFGDEFNQAIHEISWPASLQELRFGEMFNQPINEVVWPASLRKLIFGKKFDQYIHQVSWPASTQELRFGDSLFNKPINEVMWPSSLRELEFSIEFNQPIHEVAWPLSLQKLTFGVYFNQPIHQVVWPASLRELEFGHFFDQPIHEVAWPASLQELTFGCTFNQPIREVTWPALLQVLRFGTEFNQPINEDKWPASLWKLEFEYESY